MDLHDQTHPVRLAGAVTAMLLLVAGLARAAPLPSPPPDAAGPAVVLVLRAPAGRTWPGGERERRLPRQWLGLLGAADLQRLAAAGCRFEAEDLAAVQVLRRRGFDGAAIASAYRRLWTVARGAVEHLEAVAVFEALDLPWEDFAGYLASGRTLTDFYNRSYLGGERLRVAGWVIAGIAAASLVGGLVLYDAANRASRCCEDCDCAFAGLGYFIGALPLWTLAGLGAVVGIPMGAVGEARVRRWLRGRTLETDSRDALRRLAARQRIRRRAPARVEWGVAPVGTRRGGGVTFQLRF